EVSGPGPADPTRDTSGDGGVLIVRRALGGHTAADAVRLRQLPTDPGTRLPTHRQQRVVVGGCDSDGPGVRDDHRLRIVTAQVQGQVAHRPDGDAAVRTAWHRHRRRLPDDLQQWTGGAYGNCVATGVRLLRKAP